MFDPARNDGNINAFNRLFLMGWLANTDIAPCTSVKAVINYLAKYCSKSETETMDYKDMMKAIVPWVSEQNVLTSTVSRMFNKLFDERDWSAQEVMHIIMELPLKQSSRVVLLFRVNW
ncbi:unnamed protein product [Zymoseptoria tritici ST99CH_1A5]|uniref:Uncharacterized protein n=1 Tax=Zymoseptoria tritici ST99CH_1A5 TaxID=1276529 RepID=A0A1Y6LWH3_ZYMTR|nr:unnamed protein product [Zymoseptoria tritici ST99CH_1A5]